MKIIKKLFNFESYKKIFIFLVMVAMIGHILNIICEHRFFYINMYLLLIMLVIQLYVIKKIDKQNSLIEKELLNASENEVRGSFHTKTQKLLNAKNGKIISIIFVLVYIFIMFKVGCLEHTITGVYGGLLGAIVFYVGIQAYYRYLILLYFSWDLKNLNLYNYFYYNPALTEWIVMLAQEFSFIEKSFLILGLMYSTIYAINIPAGAYVINNRISVYTFSDLLFVISWAGIIIFFALAAPIFTFLSRCFIKNCIEKCKRKSIKAYEKQIEILSKDTSEETLNIVQKRLSIIKEISRSEDYPLKYEHTIWDKTYSICITSLTLIIQFTSIIEQIFFKK